MLSALSLWCPKGVSRKAVDLNENRFKISTKISTIVDKKL